VVEIKWPEPTAYIISIPMAEDRLWWRSDPEALRNVPLYTKKQVEQMLRAHGAEAVDPSFRHEPNCGARFATAGECTCGVKGTPE
jgi:hypothetical protein